MGRPREHDETTATALLDAAERTIHERGAGGLSLRALAQEAGTTTRAVYSLFGSKDGLLGALGARAFALLEEGLDGLPQVGDPREDLVQAALMFRRFALDHPALFSIGIQRTDPTVWPRFRSAAADAFAVLVRRFEPLGEAGLLGGRSVGEAATQFHALCEGLAAVELRGIPLGPEPVGLWRSAFEALIAGFGAPAPDPSKGSRARSPGAGR
jgi:AcrR family transcriptional regulator